MDTESLPEQKPDSNGTSAVAGGRGTPPVTPDATNNDEGASSGQRAERGPSQFFSSSASGEQPPEQHSLSSSSDGTRRSDKKRAASSKISAATSPPPDAEKIEKAVTFLRDDDIRDVPAAEKRRYLESRVGMTPEEVDAALDRAAGRAAGADDDDRGEDRGRWDEGEDYDRDGGRNWQRHDDRVRGTRSDHRRPNSNQHYGDDPRGYRHGRPPTVRRHPPRHYPPSDYNYMQTSEMEGTAPSSSSLPFWLGGFSMGVFFAAALRWLNGGDFSLSPSLADSVSCLESKGAEGRLHNVKEEDAEPGDLDQRGEDGLREGSGREGHESESSEGSDLGTLLDGGWGARDPRESYPSGDELALEIRSLTSAIHSCREAQERANGAALARAGKGMTDDAMDFLRRKKSEVVASRAVSRTAISDGTGLSAVSSLLAEVSADMSRLKQSISEGAKTEADRAELLTGDSDGAADTNSKDDHQPLNGIEQIMHKIQKIIGIVQGMESETRRTDSSEDKIDDALTSIGGSDISSLEPTARSTPSTMPTVQTDEEKPQQGDPAQQQSNGETTQADAELKHALMMLSAENDDEKLEAGAQMLYLYCSNISKHPSVPRYRKIYTNNSTFRDKVGNLVGAREVLAAVGFAEREGFLEWVGPDDASEEVSAARSRMGLALAALARLAHRRAPCASTHEM